MCAMRWAGIARKMLLNIHFKNHREVKKDSMKLENQVCTIEQARTLRKLGVAQDSLFMHYRGLLTSDHGIQPKSFFTGTTKASAAYSAFTVAELGVMLGENWENEVYINKTVDCETGAQERAEYLISAIEDGHFSIDEVNSRLTNS